MQATITKIKQPFETRQKKDGSGTYDAMVVEAELPSGEQIEYLMVFEQVKIADVLDVVQNGKYWNVATKPKAKANTEGFDIINQKLDKILKLLDKSEEDRYDGYQE